MSTKPEFLQKERLKTDLKKYGVSFKDSENKDYYVHLYRKHIVRGKAKAGEYRRGEFSSDEEFVKHSPKQQARKQTTPTRRPVKVNTDTYLPQVVAMSDDELLEELRAHGKDPGPVVATTRSVYQHQLAKLMAEKVANKSVPQDTQAEEEDDESEGSEDQVDTNVSYVGEWSSDEDAEEIEVEVKPTPPKRMETRQSSKMQVYVSKSQRPISGSRESSGRQKSEPHLRERIVYRESHKPVNVSEGYDSSKQRKKTKSRKPPTSGSGSFLLSFCLLVAIIVTVFLAYDYYTVGEDSIALTAYTYLKQLLIKTSPQDDVDDNQGE